MVEVYGVIQWKVSSIKCMEKRNACWTLVHMLFIPIVFLPLWPLLLSAKDLADTSTSRLIILLFSYIPILMSGMYIFATRFSKKLMKVGFYKRKW